MDAYYDCRNYGSWRLTHSEKVAQTMSKKITYMNPGQGFPFQLDYCNFSGQPVQADCLFPLRMFQLVEFFGIGVVNKKADYKMIGKLQDLGY